MTPDEIIAANVTRLRGKGVSVMQLAGRLRVSRHRVYDFERARADRTQHSFTWEELIALCAALECSLFELVLPDDGVIVDVPEWVAHGAVRPADEVQVDLGDVDPAKIDLSASPEFGIVLVDPPGREELSQIVFHMPYDALRPVMNGLIGKEFEKWRTNLEAATRQASSEAAAQMWEALRKALSASGAIEIGGGDDRSPA